MDHTEQVNKLFGKITNKLNKFIKYSLLSKVFCNFVAEKFGGYKNIAYLCTAKF